MGRILITGADGYIGSKLVEKYLQESDDHLLLWVRARNTEELELKKSKMASVVGEYAGRVDFVGATLTDEKPFAEVSPEGLTKILHTAAVIRFNVDEETAKRVNVEGTRKISEFAKSCPHLEKFGYVSSIYAAGLQEGEIKEERYTGSAGFANHYERSKWESEELLFNEFSELPWQIYRVATAVADNEAGDVTQYNAVHNTLKLFYYGLLSLIPGNKAAKVYFVTGDFAAESIFMGLELGALHKIYNVSFNASESITLDDLIEISYQYFLKTEDFKARRILKPLFVKFDAFEKMSSAVQGFGSQITSDALGTVTPFARELFSQKEVMNKNLQEVMGTSYPKIDTRSLTENLCQYLVATKWGRVSLPTESSAEEKKLNA